MGVIVPVYVIAVYNYRNRDSHTHLCHINRKNTDLKSTKSITLVTVTLVGGTLLVRAVYHKTCFVRHGWSNACCLSVTLELKDKGSTLPSLFCITKVPPATSSVVVTAAQCGGLSLYG